ncbi:hypothetical protein [Moheibacter sediminis]|uniref:Uncharacterized protein n=1 Tax=Moheibacter sediminis TaxID=1434700 RepID=A0A1W1ZV08_9FLAO|nr:hypothetical protein [Moheibacter sediminis]SMC52270.1 hypothetical protein SAMN06296427_103259 [Moheibacter sediminis]
MKQIIVLIFSLSILFFCNCKGQEKEKSLKITDFEFNLIFGSNANYPKNTYCLLGSGFFRPPSAENTKSLISEWLKKHPDAIVVSVSSFGPVDVDEPESKIVYSWVIDKQDTLNNYLIRNGSFPGGTMMRPKTWDEMEKWQKELYEDSDEKSDVEVYIDHKTYDNFIEQIKSAELYARKNKVRIWKNEGDE